MLARSLALVAAAFLAAMGLMAVTGIGVNLWTGGHPIGYLMPKPLQWTLLGILAVALVAAEAASARRRLWLALPLMPVAAYAGLLAGVFGSLFWPLDIAMVAFAAAGFRELRLRLKAQTPDRG